MPPQEEEYREEEPQEFAELPVPPRPPQVAEGRVYGGSRPFSEANNLPSYSETIVIGGDPKKEPPPPPLQPQAPSPHSQDFDQTMVSPQAHQAPQVPQAPPPPAIDKEIIAEAEARAEEMLANAQAQAEQMLGQAQAQIEQMAEQARQQAGQQGYEEGMQAGLQEGRQHGQTELAQMIDSLKFQFIDLVRLRRKVMVDMEPEIVRLAWEVAKRVVGDELKTNRDVIVGVVRSSLATLNERDEILIRVNPTEYETVKAHQTQFEAMIEGLKKFTIQSDGSIVAGSCSIETNLGNVDARIETQFEAIRLGLEEMSKIRQFEMTDQLALAPVEVPGDPDFEARMKEQGGPQYPQAQEQQGHEGHHGHPEEPAAEEEVYQEQAEMELLPEPTEEFFATLTPEQQQQYLDAYNEQQAYLQHLQDQMRDEQEE